MKRLMKSLTPSEARQYCLVPELALEVEGSAIFYKDSNLPRFVVSAPVEVRQMIAFILALVNATTQSSLSGCLVWFGRSDVGVLDSAHLGRRVLESLRLASGDPLTLTEAPAQLFGENSEAELEIFLLQAIIFGWPGHCLLTGSDYIVNFTSSQRWFFRSKEREKLTSLFSAMEAWNPVYDGSEAAAG
jgi:hypothetical protein